jgi:hypothetical protein
MTEQQGQLAGLESARTMEACNIYFWLPAVGENSSVKDVADLALYSLLTAVRAARQEENLSHTFLIVDDFQQMALSTMIQLTNLADRPHQKGRGK